MGGKFGAAAALKRIAPDFVSVTYGAGGSTREKTLATVCDIAALGHEAAPHLSCVGSTADGIAEIKEALESGLATKSELGTILTGKPRPDGARAAAHPRGYSPAITTKAGLT